MGKRFRSWFHRIVKRADCWFSNGSDGLNDLAIGMLGMKPEERFAARECLKRGSDLGLFDGYTIDAGSATPTPQTALQGEISDGDDGSTIILGAFWGTDETSPEYASGSLEPLPTQFSTARGCSGLAKLRTRC